ncbi:MAG: bifunctional hydroxymethylpyrimidine kinase/phosphomethylpyrimidine kinase [Rikenellaceae bacterium]
MNKVLTIAGSDSGGGAGIQADIKSISANGAYAASAITAITVQNTVGVRSVLPIPPQVIADQIDAVMEDIGADAIKIGMLHSAEVVEVVCRAIDRHKPRWVVLDPVMVSTSGHRLIEQEAIDTLCNDLIPRCSIITPNIPEAEIIDNSQINSPLAMESVVRRITARFGVSTLLKAGHIEGCDELTDLLCSADRGAVEMLTAPFIKTRNTHGTGCTLSAAIAAQLANGLELVEAVKVAKKYLHNALVAGAGNNIGGGHGPVDHFYSGVFTSTHLR